MPIPKAVLMNDSKERIQLLTNMVYRGHLSVHVLYIMTKTKTPLK